MAKPDAAAVAKILQELAQRMELERGNPYRARAYARAAENLSLSPEPLDRLIIEGRLTEIPASATRSPPSSPSTKPANIPRWKPCARKRPTACSRCCAFPA
jgi:hypothetical protein